MALNSHDGSTPGYCEYLVKAKAGTKVLGIRLAALLVGLLLIFSFMKLLMKIPQVLFLWLVIVIALEIIVFSKTRREFEYTIASGVMTVDVIYGKSIRKKLFEARISLVTAVTYVGDGASAVLGAREIHACNKNDANRYCMLVPKSDEGEAVVLYFSGCEKLLNCIKYYNRTCISNERKD